MKKTNTYKLAICAVMVALGAVLSLIKLWKMPFGGSVTLLSMLPCAVVSIAFGLKWGLAASFVEAVIQLMFGIMMDGIFAWGLTPGSLIAVIVLDYHVLQRRIHAARNAHHDGGGNHFIPSAAAEEDPLRRGTVNKTQNAPADCAHRPVGAFLCYVTSSA